MPKIGTRTVARARNDLRIARGEGMDSPVAGAGSDIDAAGGWHSWQENPSARSQLEAGFVCLGVVGAGRVPGHGAGDMTCPADDAPSVTQCGRSFQLRG